MHGPAELDFTLGFNAGARQGTFPGRIGRKPFGDIGQELGSSDSVSVVVHSKIRAD